MEFIEFSLEDLSTASKSIDKAFTDIPEGWHTVCIDKADIDGTKIKLTLSILNEPDFNNRKIFDNLDLTKALSKTRLYGICQALGFTKFGIEEANGLAGGLLFAYTINKPFNDKIYTNAIAYSESGKEVDVSELVKFLKTPMKPRVEVAAKPKCEDDISF